MSRPQPGEPGPAGAASGPTVSANSRPGAPSLPFSLAAYGVAGAAVGAWSAIAHAASTDPSRRLQLAERAGAWQGAVGSVRGGVWVHAASIGEVTLAGRVARSVRRTHRALPLLLTCNTSAGRAAAAPEFDEVRYAPLDRAAVVRKVLDRVRPSLYVFVEAEIWPVLLIEMNRARVPAVMVNARVSERSFARYRLAGGLIRRALGSLERVCARDEESARRLIALGARREATVVCGDMKLDTETVSGEAAGSADSVVAGPSPTPTPMLVAASVRTAEIAEVLDALARLRRRGRRVSLVLAPRYVDDASTAIERAARHGLSAQRSSDRASVRDRSGAAPAWPDVLVLDSYGELGGYYTKAVGCFVGGTLDRTGGHNIAEPAAARIPVVTGPSLQNVQAHAAALVQCGGLQVAESAEDLAGIWENWLDQPEDARERGRRARACIEQRRGATTRVAAELEPWLNRAADSPARQSGVRP
jgi:3-deoxy-D-manno-octulosonic-acid transferase